MCTSNRVVVLIDMDCFFCQVEEGLNPALRGKPLAVVQYNPWRGGGIIAVNYAAREQGVTRHMRGQDAKEKCPSIELVTVPQRGSKADTTRYRDAGKRVADVLQTFTTLVERASVDEAYLDITSEVNKRIAEAGLHECKVENMRNTYVVGVEETGDFLKDVIQNREFAQSDLMLAVGGLIVEEIRAEVYNKTGYRCSAGIAHNKILAKLVCSLHKPNKQTILPEGAVQNFFKTLPLQKIRSLGGKFGQAVVDQFNIKFMGQLAGIPRKELAKVYDEKTTNWLYNVARGVDLDPVQTKMLSKSIGSSKNFTGPDKLTTEEKVKHWLVVLSEEIVIRLEKDLEENERKAKQMIVGYSQDTGSGTRSTTLLNYDAQKIAAKAYEIIQKICQKSDGSYSIKHMSISTGHFETIKKTRSITSFFKCENKGEHNEENIKTIDYDPVFLESTQAESLNEHSLEFYDDNLTVKKEETNCDINMKKKSSDNNNKESHSFQITAFTEHYNTAKNSSTNTKNIDSTNSHISKNNHSLSYEDLFQICPECNKKIEIIEYESHQDYHFALKLVREEAPLYKNNNIEASIQTRKGTAKKDVKSGVKRKASKVTSSNILTFFKKERIGNDETELCLECYKKIKIDDASCHRDFHAALKLQRQINSNTIEK